MEDGIGAKLVGKLGHLGNGHHGANLVVYHHNGDQNGVRTQGGLQSLGGNGAGAVRLEVGDFEALGLQILHGIQNGMVLHGGGDDVLTPLAQPLDGGLQSPVVGLGAAGGEVHPVGLCTQSGGYGMAGTAQSFRGIKAKAIQGAGIGPVFGEGSGYGLHRFLTGLGGGRIV